jgi:TolB-like protein
MSGTGRLQIRLLGQLEVLRDGARVPLPASRKAVALLAYLLLAPRPVPREALCDLLWDGPDDPRGELRWTLSRLRRALEAPGRPVFSGDGAFVAIDRSAVAVDVHTLASVAAEADAAALRDALAQCRGGFLDGWQPPRGADFAAWLEATREEWRLRQAALLARLAGTLPGGDPERAALLRARAAIAPDGPAVPAAPAEAATPEPPAGRRPSIAVMPFRAATPGAATLADGLAHDVIGGLARLRGLFVIARGSTFACRDVADDPRAIGARLGVTYACTGHVMRARSGLSVAVELASTAEGRVIWAETYAGSPDDVLGLRDSIADRIVVALDAEILAEERNRALHKPIGSLDAWEAYHRGLWHMHRYTRADNDLANQLFARAIRLEPTFARAYAGLSFTHFQNAFLLRTAERAREIDLAYDSAGRGLMADLRDPSAHWAMGRALWLRRAPGEALRELDQAVQLSPNFAMGHYGLAFVQSQSGDPTAAVAAAESSAALSPYDPLLFGFHASRTIALVRLGQVEAAAESARRIGAQPNANAHARAIGMLALAQAEAIPEARAILAAIRRQIPEYGIADFISAFRYDDVAEAHFRAIWPKLEAG